MAAPRRPRGTRDILPEEQPLWRHAVGRVDDACERFGYRRLTTPTFEAASLFLRGVGEGTELRDEQMYVFRDPGGEELALRAEGTAPFVRAYLELGMRVLPQPVKLYGIMEVFRFERPQAGRFREHRQWNVEAIGEADPALDAEVISLAWTTLQEMGLGRLSLQLNSIGDSACRPGYLQRLVEHYRGHVKEICPNCRRRLEINPLRVLDCKEAGCQAVIAGAPQSADYLCAACKEHFDRLRDFLSAMDLPFSQNHLLVRGLDYYTRTVFEIWVEGIGAQNALGGGGRYDGLAEQLGGPPTPGVGFGVGLDRVVLALQEQGLEVGQPPRPQVYLAHLGLQAATEAGRLALQLRRTGYRVEMAFGQRSLKAQLRAADRGGAAVTLILGEEESRRGTVVVRDMAASDQWELSREEVFAKLAEVLDGRGGG